MRSVAAAATFGFDRHVLKGEWALLIGMALEAHSVACSGAPHLPESRGAVDVVTVAALHQTFIHPVPERLGEI